MEDDMFFGPKPTKSVECVFCKWTGQLKDCKAIEVNSPPRAWRALAGREGTEWLCPKCKMIIESHYTKMS